jgi:hypothetical protein
MKLTGVSAMAAPMMTWKVNSPRNIGAAWNRRDTGRSTPMASLMA